MLEELKNTVFKANLRLKESGLVILTWGNASQIDRESGLVVIKPSGIPYDAMTPNDMVTVDLNGNVVDGKRRPSSDLYTHLEIYKQFDSIGGITHTHSRWATVFAQAGQAIPMLGTTHADTFYGDIPCTRRLTADEISGDYERETGRVICEAFAGKNPMDMPGVLVCSHGPFTWGKSAEGSVENAEVLEETAMMAWHTLKLNPTVEFQKELADKHYFRKHGANAYYGQK